MTCVGECGGRDDAVTAIVERAPDVVLLDIQLGRATAFEIIEEIGVDATPLVVFVTAYDRHAAKAFVVRLRDGTKIITSRYYQPTLRRLLEAGET